MSGEVKIQRGSLDSLIKACKAHDRQAQIRLYSLFAKKMFNISKRIVKDSMLAEDIIQESFLTIFKLIGTFRGEVPFEFWLRKIVINRSIDHFRKNKIITDELDESKIPYYYEPDWDLGYNSEKEFIDEIKKQINNLPDGFRTIITLHLIEGYDHEEIGQILKISASTSRSQFTRARRKLIELLAKNKIYYD